MYTCTGCKATKTERTSANGHQDDSGKIVKEATCKTEGSKMFTCLKCGDSYSKNTGIIDHNYISGKCSMCSEIIPCYESGKLLDEFQNVSFYYKGICHWGTNYMMVEVTNNTDETITVQVRNDYVNGHQGLISASEKVAPHSKTTMNLYVSVKDLANYGEDIVEHVEFNFCLYYSLRTENKTHISPQKVSFAPYS